MPENALSAAVAKPDRFLTGVKRTQAIIALAYAYDAAMVFGFFFAGYVNLAIPLIFVSLCSLFAAAVAWAHLSGWSRGRNDPTLFLPQQLFAISIALIMAVLAPQIGFQPIATLFAICAFGFMAPSTKSFILSWSAGAAGTIAIIAVIGHRLEMPTSTLAGQVLTAGVVIGLLARCVWASTFVRRLQRRLTEKNVALKSAMERIETLANRDELTGLPNRRAVTSWLDEQIKASARTKQSLSVALIDLDHFKQINDTYGHQAGDRTLQLFAGIAQSALRDTDRIGRFGGEEFLVILPGAALRSAKGPLERIRDNVAAFEWNGVGSEMHMTITVGIAQHLPGEAAEALVRRADMALYLGKESGRNRVVTDQTPLSALATSEAV